MRLFFLNLKKKEKKGKTISNRTKKKQNPNVKFNSIIPGQYHNVGQPPQNPNAPEKPPAPATDNPVNLDNRFGEPVWDYDEVPQVNQNSISNTGSTGKHFPNFFCFYHFLSILLIRTFPWNSNFMRLAHNIMMRYFHTFFLINTSTLLLYKSSCFVLLKLTLFSRVR